MPDAIRTAPRKARVLPGPPITFSVSQEIDRLRKQPEWMGGDQNSVTAVKTSNFSMVVTALKTGAALRGHEIAGAFTLQVISGTVHLRVAGGPRTLLAGTVIALDKSIRHDILALEESELLLTIMKDVQ